MTVIATNISALEASTAATNAAKMQNSAMQRLSTGTRINSAADDAAGLAIANTMTAQITGMQQAVQNSNDGISLAQTGDGALNEVTNMLQRIRQLAVQAGSGTYQQSDRNSMQSEVSNLTDQISKILTTTQFNGNNLFTVASGTAPANGSSDLNFVIQTGANTGDTMTIQSAAFSGANLFGGTDTTYNASSTTPALNVSTVTGANTTITNVDAAISQVDDTQATFGAAQNRLSSVVNNLNDNITNLSAARSTIQDTNYSAETTNLAKAQILSQASTAMVAQANQAQQNVLSLLKG